MNPFWISPQKTFLGLISTGSKHAIASWGSVSLGGASSTGSVLWAWKDRIDRKWMKMHQEMPQMLRARARRSQLLRSTQAPPPLLL